MNNLSSLTEKERQAIRELVDGLKKLYGDNLSRVILYGSKARGDAGKDSDIDIMVALKEYEKREEEFQKICDIAYAIEDKYDYDVFISIVVKKEDEILNRNTPLLLNVRREGVTLWMR